MNNNGATSKVELFDNVGNCKVLHGLVFCEVQHPVLWPVPLGCEILNIQRVPFEQNPAFLFREIRVAP